MSHSLSRTALLTLFLLAIAAMAGCASAQKDRDTADLHLRIGTSFLTQGNFPNAMRELQTAEKLDPKNPVIQNNLGLVYFMREKYESAAQHLERALKLNPAYSEARNNYGRVLIELGRYDKAIEELQKVAKDLTYQDPAKAHVNLGLAYFRRGDYSSARNQFSEAIKLNRDNCLAQTYFGRSLLEMSQLPQAATALDNAVVVCRPNKFDEPHYYSGLTYYKLGQVSSAVSRMEEIINLYPEGRFAKRAESLLKLMK